MNALVTGERVDVPAGTHVVDRGPRPRRARSRQDAASRGRPTSRTSSHGRRRRWTTGSPLGPPGPSRSSSRSPRDATKEWDAGETAAFCRALAAKGLDPVLRWGPGERERAARIVAASGGAASLAPPSPPAASARLASRAALFVGADTGPTHLAAAAGTPTVALFGPTDPARFGPVGPRVRILRDGSGAYNAGLRRPSRPDCRCRPRRVPRAPRRAGRRPDRGVGRLSALLALVLAGPLAASVTANVLPNLGREELPKDKVAPVPFDAGETLVYTISWLKIEGGEMTLATTRETSPDGVPVHRIRLSAVSNDYVSRFYPVDTRYETWVDARDFSPVRFEKHAREGRYASDEVEEFDLARRVAVWRDDEGDPRHRTDPGALPGRDLLLLLHADGARSSRGRRRASTSTRAGSSTASSSPSSGREKVETELGVFDALKVQPRMHDSARRRAWTGTRGSSSSGSATTPGGSR